MANETLELARPPRFKAGEQIKITAPGPHKGQRGIVQDVTRPDGDVVYRYLVQFPDGALARFFGFELEADNAVNPITSSRTVNRCESRCDRNEFRALEL
jgi:hypothetical protein